MKYKNKLNLPAGIAIEVWKRKQSPCGVMTIKERLQVDISSGQINSKQDLLVRAAQLGLRVTRNGRYYVGLLEPNGTRFRIHFNFLDENLHQSTDRNESVSRTPYIGSNGYWIYVLTARSYNGEQKACYVGQTVNLKRRFHEHLRRSLPSHGAFALFKWASNEQVEVCATVLTWVNGDQKLASRFEGYWLKLAVQAGFNAPDVQNWGRLPISCDAAGQPSRWPEQKILAAAQPLSQLVKLRFMPVELYVTSPRVR